MTKINHEEYEVLKEHYDMGGKWIARDADDLLYYYKERPNKLEHPSDNIWDSNSFPMGTIGDGKKLFHFVKWTDSEPYNIAELIKEYESVKTEVKKNKLWAKLKIQEELNSWQNVEGGIDEDGVKYILDIIDQLDETEVLSQEWIDEHAMEVTYDEILDQPEIVYVVELKNLLVPKQELPVVPKFVADWWERDDDSVTMYEGVRIEKKHKLDLVSFFQDRGLSDSLSEVEDWLDENDSIFLDLVNGKPYEVEKEKLYIVQLPTNSEDDLIILDADGDIWKDCWPSQYKMTEQRIKEIDERYWPFAVEVAE